MGIHVSIHVSHPHLSPRGSGTFRTCSSLRLLRIWLVRIRETNEKMKWKMKISHKFWKFLAFSKIFSHFFSKYRDSFSFPDHFCEIPAKFHQIFAEKSQNSSKNENEKWNFIFIPAKIWTVFRWNFEIWAVQKYENLVALEKCCKMTIWLLS